MKKLLIAATLLVATSALATNLATVNGETVTSDDLVAAFVARHSGHAKFLGGEIEARRFLDILIDERLIVQEAYNLGIDEEQDVVARVADFEARKASDYLVWQEIEEKARPTPEQVREVWTRDLGFYVQARQIVVATRAEAEEIREGLLHGGDVEFFARTCSAADSRRNGGAIVAAWGNFTPEWERVVFALKPGELSPVIETRDGFELVLVDDRVETKPPEFEKISQQIESTLRQRGLEERKRVFSDELWTKYHATMQLTDFTNPGAIVATWDGGGSMALKDALTRGELHMLSRLPPRRARFEIESRIRASVNGPLVALEAKARKTADDPTVAKAIDKYREAAMQTVLFREHIYRDATVTDDEARAYYDEHRSQFEMPEQRQVAQILVASEADAKTMYTQLITGADFAELAQHKSRDAQSASSGGDLGWINATNVPAAFNEVLTLAKGNFTKPIHSENGWHIIKVLDTKPKSQRPFDEVKDEARRKALDIKQKNAQLFWVQKLRAAAEIQVDDGAVKEFVRLEK